jgi:two-component system response regulator HydG
MQKIRAYPWPGNVRELENILERSLLFTNDKEMTVLDLELPAKTKSLEQWRDIKEQAITRVEQAFLENGLKQHYGDIKKIAENMGMTTRAVYGKLKKYNIKLTDYRETK